jgi:small-conductance mechanosensitive channel
MNELLRFEFSGLSLLKVLILSILLVLVLRLLRKKVIEKMLKTKSRQWYQIGEIAIWMIYGAWALHLVLGESLYYKLTILLILMVIVIWVSWFVVRDFIAGLVLKLNESLKPGQYFKLDDIDGTIIDTDYLQLNLRQESGVVVKIPYNRISGSVHYKGEAEEQSIQCRFEIEIEDRFSVEEVRHLTRKAVFLSAGTRLNREPRIIYKGKENKKQKFDIIVPVFNADYNKLIEGNVKEALGLKA